MYIITILKTVLWTSLVLLSDAEPESLRAEDELEKIWTKISNSISITTGGIHIADIRDQRIFKDANPTICTIVGATVKKNWTKMSISDIHPKDSLEWRILLN